MKHRLASDLEERRWQFKTLELKYLEAGQHLRSLNQLMWQVPSMVIESPRDSRRLFGLSQPATVVA